jgi:protein-L-isoaspartate(D-aspartate) O-methyltransferase
MANAALVRLICELRLVEASWFGYVFSSGSPSGSVNFPQTVRAALAMTNTSLQRQNMVESQVRTSDVTHRGILRAMREVPRENFAPGPFRTMAYMDEPLQIATGRYLLAPRTFAKLVQLAEVGEAANVLDIGAATGYSSAVLAKMAKTILALECDSGLAAQAVKNLKLLGMSNVKVVIGPLAEGAASDGPYDAIILNGAVPNVPAALLDQLKDDGTLVAILAQGPIGKATAWRRFGRVFDARSAFDAGAPELPGFEHKTEFVL